MKKRSLFVFLSVFLLSSTSLAQEPSSQPSPQPNLKPKEFNVQYIGLRRDVGKSYFTVQVKSSGPPLACDIKINESECKLPAAPPSGNALVTVGGYFSLSQTLEIKDSTSALVIETTPRRLAKGGVVGLGVSASLFPLALPVFLIEALNSGLDDVVIAPTMLTVGVLGFIASGVLILVDRPSRHRRIRVVE